MQEFVVGQRWTSETEPELGLGVVKEINPRVVTVFYPAAEELRSYASESAPLKRVVFDVGVMIKNQEGYEFTITEVKQQNGLCFYFDHDSVIPEFEISASMEPQGPAARVTHFDFDELNLYTLRREILSNQHYLSERQTAGFVGGRMDLIPHQLYVADNVSKRQYPRVLLADEVGLGKTIEAALILHRLIRTHKVSRVLILVPKSLLHQWLVELVRRFNLWFDIFDEEYCLSVEAESSVDNPFLTKQCVLCDLEFFSKYPQRAVQALEAEWDVVVVDEAHHLEWTPEKSSIEYDFVLALAKICRGLLLLTATPEQLGPSGHFARLRLLDPDRYFDIKHYQEESKNYQAVAALSQTLASRKDLDKKQKAQLAGFMDCSPDKVDEHIASIGKPAFYRKALQHLLDRHGVGRVMLRNTRSVMKNFPQRKAELEMILPDSALVKKITEEQLAEYEKQEAALTYQLADDPRVLWLDTLLRKLKAEKILLICKSLTKAKAIEQAVKEQRNIKIALFHEELSLIQRDRQAAWFADPDGAQLLICSEIGSEGRNFQFAHHLVLFDVPYDPEILEQRIGRLDRIGQKKNIFIHVPCVQGTPQEVWVTWYHRALNAFEENCPGATVYLSAFADRLKEIMYHQVNQSESDHKIYEKLMNELVRETSALKMEVQEKLKAGRDRLLELSSFDAEAAERLVQEIHECDGDFVLEEMMERVFDQFGILVEEIDARTYSLKPGANYYTDAFPTLRKEGMTITYDRIKAITHEDIHFMTWDHPMVAGVVDLILGSEKGNAAFAAVDCEEDGLVLESNFVMECLAPRHFNIVQYLPREPLRILVRHDLEEDDEETFLSELKPAGKDSDISDKHSLRPLLKRMIEKSEDLAESHKETLIRQSLANLDEIYVPEIERLKYLKSLNPHISEREIKATEEEYRTLKKLLKTARLRADSYCLMRKISE